ncbi:MAG: hypothetical protein ACOZAO_03805 [Patescibacteria group bacterium]
MTIYGKKIPVWVIALLGLGLMFCFAAAFFAGVLLTNNGALPENPLVQVGASPAPRSQTVSAEDVTLAGSGAIETAVCIHVDFTWDDGKDKSMLETAKQIGADCVRVGSSWRLQEKVQGAYETNWYVPALVQRLVWAQENDLAVILIQGQTPCWASADPNKPECVNAAGEGVEAGFDFWCPAPEHFGAFAQSVRFLVENNPGYIVAVEVWNEPNDAAFWCGNPDPAAYTELVRQTAVALEGLDVQIYGGAIAGADTNFTQALFDAGIGNHIDAFTLHAYSGSLPPSNCGNPERSFLCGIQAVHEVAVENGFEGPLVVTEVGWPTNPIEVYNLVGQDETEDTLSIDVDSFVLGEDGFVTEPTQAQYLVNAIKLANQMPFVQGVVLFEMLDRPGEGGAPSIWRDQNYGLFDLNGDPKEAAFALQEILVEDE